MERVTSGDGTPIAFERSGDGPPVVLVGAGQGLYRPLAARLAERFTVLNYDRRGRGDSGDTAPYAVEREIEDLAAVVARATAEAGGTASVYGHSSGAALALRAAALGLPISRLVLHEPPHTPEDENQKRASRELAETIRNLLAEGRSGDAIAHVFGADATGMPQEMIDDLMPVPVEELSRDEAVLAMAHTFAYDLDVAGDTDGTVWTDVAGAVTAPALVLTEEADYPWVFDANKQLADAMPDGRHSVLGFQESIFVDPEALASAVAEFFADREDRPDRAGR